MANQLPGTKMWHADLVAFTVSSDWDVNNGGVIRWSDGTLWSYEAEAPAGNDQRYGFPTSGFCISELKPGSEFWERLTPDGWGDVSGSSLKSPPPGYANWPGVFGVSPWNATLEGPIGLANVSDLGSTAWIHVQDGDEVWLYAQDGANLGPLRLSKDTRTWKRYVITQASSELWGDINSNLIIWDAYLWFFAWPASAGKGYRFCRAERANPNNVVVVHEFDNPSGWQTGVDTLSLDLPGWFDSHQYWPPQTAAEFVIDDDGYVWVSYYAVINSFASNQMEFAAWRRFKIGDYVSETMFWYSNQGYPDGDLNIGYDADEAGTVGQYKPSDYAPDVNGAGFTINADWSPALRDGWLYWFQQGRHSGVFGSSFYLCRMRLEDMNGQRFNRLDPQFEIITNGANPYQGNAGHAVRYGTWIWMRLGATPILPMPDCTFAFEDDGSILYKAMCFPDHIIGDNDGWGTRCIIRLKERKDENIEVKLTFSGVEMQGYGNIREVPVSREEVVVELS